MQPSPGARGAWATGSPLAAPHHQLHQPQQRATQQAQAPHMPNGPVYAAGSAPRKRLEQDQRMAHQHNLHTAPQPMVWPQHPRLQFQQQVAHAQPHPGYPSGFNQPQSPHAPFYPMPLPMPLPMPMPMLMPSQHQQAFSSMNAMSAPQMVMPMMPMASIPMPSPSNAWARLDRAVSGFDRLNRDGRIRVLDRWIQARFVHSRVHTMTLEQLHSIFIMRFRSPSMVHLYIFQELLEATGVQSRHPWTTNMMATTVAIVERTPRSQERIAQTIFTAHEELGNFVPLEVRANPVRFLPDLLALLTTGHKICASDVPRDLPTETGEIAFAPHASPNARNQWEDLVLRELDASPQRAAACKINRGGVFIQCVSQRNQSQEKTDADFGLVPVLPRARPDWQSHLAHLDPRINGEAEEEGEFEEGDAGQDRAQAQHALEAEETEEDGEEVRIAAKYAAYHPLVDFSSAAPTGVEAEDDEDDSASWPSSHSHASSSRRIFSVRNSQDFPVVVMARFLQLTHAERQFDLASGPEGLVGDFVRLTLAPQATGEIHVRARRAEQVGLVVQHLAFHIELPALWERGPTRADSLLAFETSHFVVVRALKVINTDPTLTKVLSRESAPFFPAGLRALFDTPAFIHLDAPPPLLPTSFVDAIANVEQCELPAHLVRLNAERANPLQRATAVPAFEAAWAGHVEHMRHLWASMPDAVQQAALEGRESSSDEEPEQVRTAVRMHLFNLHVGLQAEELQMSLDVRAYDLFFVRLQPAATPARDTREYALIRVPGVAERRPAVALGEPIELRLAEDEDGASEPGVTRSALSITVFVVSVQDDLVRITFPTTEAAHILQKTPTEVFTRRFHARFAIDRLPLRFMYRALLMLHGMPHAARFLFPHPGHQSSPPRLAQLPELQPFDDNVNFEQLTCVQHILAGSARQVPFVIFGPPGTGKTLTVVEAILQVLRFHPASSATSARILVVAPSNTAADLIVERLSPHIPRGSMLRLNSHQRHTGVKAAVQRYLCFDEDQPAFYGLPKSANALLAHSVVVMTCAMAGVLVDLGVPRGSFSHIVFDESCQALEAEALIPLCMADASTQVVLAGDHLQLGAEVHSPVAAQLGLKMSLQERLLRGDLYRHSLAQLPHEGTCCAVQLTKNYRSHAQLLAISSSLFYENRLQPYADPATANSLVDWEGLPNRSGFPLLFHGTIGADSYEQEYASFSNPLEASVVVRLIEQLLASRTVAGLTTNDIGVIAPFRKQVIILRQMLRARGLGSVRVGSVDDNQGSEEKVIFISTTVSRSRSDLGTTTGAPSAAVPLGILRNAARFNVALSRAKALTVVVGNPHLLAHEDHWRDLLVYALENGAYSGCPCPLQKEVERRRMLGSGQAQEHGHGDSEFDSHLQEHEYGALPVRHPLLDAFDLGDIDPRDITGGWADGSSLHFDGAWRIML